MAPALMATAAQAVLVVTEALAAMVLLALPVRLPVNQGLAVEVAATAARADSQASAARQAALEP